MRDSLRAERNFLKNSSIRTENFLTIEIDCYAESLLDCFFFGGNVCCSSGDLISDVNSLEIEQKSSDFSLSSARNFELQPPTTLQSISKEDTSLAASSISSSTLQFLLISISSLLRIEIKRSRVVTSWCSLHRQRSRCSTRYNDQFESHLGFNRS